MSEPVRFYISDVAVRIDGAPDDVARALRAVWGACEAPLVPSAREVCFSIEPQLDGFRILRDGAHVGGSASRTSLLPRIERALYGSFPGWHPPPRAILHAAAVAFGSSVLVLAGRSGAGKSTMARALLARGGLYLTDELVITDGRRIWGLPRAIQFDACPLDEPPPPWLGDVDLHSYRFVEADGRTFALPLVPPRPVQREPLPAELTRVVLLARSTRTALREASPLEALAELHAGAFSSLATDLGPLVRAPLHLAWDDPSAAAGVLLERVWREVGSVESSFGSSSGR